MTNVVNKLMENIVDHRWKVILLCIIITVLSALPMRHLYFLQTQELFLPTGDSTLEEFEKIRDYYGPNQSLQISLYKDGGEHAVFNPEVIAATKAITEYLDGHELTVKVSSLSNHQYMERKTTGLWLRDFVTDEDYNADADTLHQTLTARTEQAKLLYPQLLTKDKQKSRITAVVAYRENDIMQHVEIMQDIRAFIADKGYEQQGLDFYYSGYPIIAADSAMNNAKDQQILLPVLLLLLIIVLRVVLGRWAYVWQPIVLAIFTTFITLGVMGLIDFPLNMLNASLPFIILAISVVDGVHLVTKHNHFLLKGNTGKEAAYKAACVLWRPCWFTTLTTSLGFLALSVSSMIPVYQYGVMAAFAIVVAYLLTMTLLVAWLSFIDKPSKSSILVEKLPKYLVAFGQFGVKYRRGLIAVTLGLSALGIVGASSLTADANYVNYFHSDAPVAQGLHHFDDAYGGSNNLEISIDSGSEGGVLEPAFLARIAKLEGQLYSLPGVGKSLLLTDYMRDIHRVFTGKSELPDTRQKVAQYLFLYASNDPVEDLTELRSFDNRHLRVSLPIKNQDALLMQDLLDEVQVIIAQDFSDANTIISGDILLAHKTGINILKNLQQSFLLALGAILLCLLVQFRSIKLGLLALIPCVLPLLIAGSLMSIFNIYLDFGTMIVAAITIGLAVDDTIHLINDYQMSRKSGSSAQEAVKVALAGAGLAIMATSIILICAFSVMIFGSFMPNVYLGIFATVIIIGAVIADLVLTPALLVSMKSEREPQIKTAKGV